MLRINLVLGLNIVASIFCVYCIHGFGK